MPQAMDAVQDEAVREMVVRRGTEWVQASVHHPLRFPALRADGQALYDLLVAWGRFPEAGLLRQVRHTTWHMKQDLTQCHVGTLTQSHTSTLAPCCTYALAQ